MEAGVITVYSTMTVDVFKTRLQSGGIVFTIYEETMKLLSYLDKN
jgi:hypothetical protein